MQGGQSVALVAFLHRVCLLMANVRGKITLLSYTFNTGFISIAQFGCLHLIRVSSATLVKQ